MALWDRLSSRGNVEDRRSMSPVTAIGGGVSLTGLALMLLFNYLGGGNLTDVINQLPTSTLIDQQPDNNSQYDGQDSYEVFASTVLGSANDLWSQVMAQNNRSFIPPKLVLFRSATNSACGIASSEVGPHYCPVDNIIYLDETFFDELTNKLGAQGGDVAQAYVIAHEAGHAAQNQLGILDQVSDQQDNDSSIKIELQADCFAGLWANSIKDRGVLEPGEISEAMDAAAAVGDDRIQKRTTGYVNPETWTHGSSNDRLAWFNRGYESGDFSQCNTFN